MEEDIKILKEALEEVACCSYHDEMCLKAIEYINKLEKENKELKENYKIILADRKRLEELLLLSDEDYIPKSKIEDKINELEGIKLCGGKIQKAVTETEISLLKSLLEE